MNPGEAERFRKSLADVVNGKAPLEPLLKSRENATRGRVPKVTVETRINFDDDSSAHSTLLEIVTQDHRDCCTRSDRRWRGWDATLKSR